MHKVNTLAQLLNKDIERVHAIRLSVGDNLPLCRAQAGLGASGMYRVSQISGVPVNGFMGRGDGRLQNLEVRDHRFEFLADLQKFLHHLLDLL